MPDLWPAEGVCDHCCHVVDYASECIRLRPFGKSHTQSCWWQFYFYRSLGMWQAMRGTSNA